jgi:hypothetical protein
LEDGVTAERYKIIGGVQIIEIRVRDVQQLFDARDPSPFRERDLDEHFSEYLEACVDEMYVKYPLRIQIDIAQSDTKLGEEVIRSAIREYFNYQIQIKKGRFKKMLRTAQLFLGIGVLFLFACLVIARYIPQSEASVLGRTLREGVVIFGWVSLWRPLELIMFDWYPIYDRIRVYSSLENADIDLIFESQKVL